MAFKWYGSLQACHNPVVIPSSSIHIIVGLLRYRPLSQATCYHVVQITSLTSRHGTHLFLGSVERHCESNLSGKRAQHNRQTRIPRPQTQIPRLPVQRRNHEATAPHTRHRRYASFGAKVCSDISPRTLSVPSSKQFSVSFNKQITSKDKYPGIRFK